jgi:hypothetical protein
MFAEMDVPSCGCDYSVPVVEAGSFHGNRLSSDAVFLRVEEERDSEGIEEVLRWGICGYDAGRSVELHISKPKLRGAAVGLCLGIFTGSEAEEERYLD